MSEPTRATEAAVLGAALAWGSRRVGIVPVRDVGPGQLVPMIRWQEGGSLRGPERIHVFYAAHPDAGLAIALDNSQSGGPRLGCVDDDSGKHDPGALARPSPLGGYRESTRSGGMHDFFRYVAPLPPGIPSRVTGCGGFVDVLVGGIVYVAPTLNRGKGQYRAIVGLDAGIPEFLSVSLALDAASPWLKEAWKARARGEGHTGPGAQVRSDPQSLPADVAEVLSRMRESGRAGELAAWIAEHTTGDSRDYSLCYLVAGHAVAVGATPEQVRSVVACPHAEWEQGRALDRAISRLQGKPPAGVAALLRFAEGRAADMAVPEPVPRPVVRAADVARFRRRVARPIIDAELVDRFRGGGRRE